MAELAAGTRVVRHPIRGALAGLVLGLGMSLLLISFSVIALGTLTPLVIVGLFLVLGVLVATLVPPLGRGAAPQPPPVPQQAQVLPPPQV